MCTYSVASATARYGASDSIWETHLAAAELRTEGNVSSQLSVANQIELEKGRWHATGNSENVYRSLISDLSLLSLSHTLIPSKTSKLKSCGRQATPARQQSAPNVYQLGAVCQTLEANLVSHSLAHPSAW